MYIGKKHKILVGVLAGILFLTIGYSIFSQNITINGTATAKGNFSLSSTCEMGFSDDITNYVGLEKDEMQDGYAEESCIASGDTVNMNLSLLYPGATRYFTVTITNTGNIDAVLPLGPEGGQEYKISQTVEVYNISDNSLIDKYSSSSSNFFNNARLYARFINFADGSLMFVKDVSGEVSMDANELSMMVVDDSGNNYLRLKPGESAIVVINVEWNKNATDQTKYSKVIGTLSLPFTQTTMDMQETSEGNFCFNGC